MNTRRAKNRSEAKKGALISQKYGGEGITAEMFLEGSLLINVGPNRQINGAYNPVTGEYYAENNVQRRMKERLANV